MAYRYKIAEITEYFSTITPFFYSFSKDIYNLKDEKNVQNLRDYVLRRLADISIDEEVAFTPVKPIDILIFMKTFEYIKLYSGNVNIYKLSVLELRPQSWYMYHFSTVRRRLAFWIIKSAESGSTLRETMIDFDISSIYWSLPDIMFIALNFRELKPIMKPEHFKVIEWLWKIYFGDIE